MDVTLVFSGSTFNNRRIDSLCNAECFICMQQQGPSLTNAEKSGSEDWLSSADFLSADQELTSALKFSEPTNIVIDC
jgi:hypothetical protein